MGLTHNFQGLMAARFFLGLAEAGLFPGINYYLSCWYRRSEFGIRAAIFFSAAAVSGSFGGLLAAAIGKMDGIGGKRGWAWIFILEGLATILVAIASYWMVFDFPDTATFLSDVDRQRVHRRLVADQQSSAEHEQFRMSYFWASVKDWKTWLGAIVYMVFTSQPLNVSCLSHFQGADGPLYAFSLFLPSIISSVRASSSIARLKIPGVSDLTPSSSATNQPKPSYLPYRLTQSLQFSLSPSATSPIEHVNAVCATSVPPCSASWASPCYSRAQMQGCSTRGPFSAHWASTRASQTPSLGSATTPRAFTSAASR